MSLLEKALLLLVIPGVGVFIAAPWVWLIWRLDQRYFADFPASPKPDPEKVMEQRKAEAFERALIRNSKRNA